ncbi:Hypothetical protein FKW44_016955, partial [Caligus rogercresseyi]
DLEEYIMIIGFWYFSLVCGQDGKGNGFLITIKECPTAESFHEVTEPNKNGF